MCTHTHRHTQTHKHSQTHTHTDTHRLTGHSCVFTSTVQRNVTWNPADSAQNCTSALFYLNDFPGVCALPPPPLPHTHARAHTHTCYITARHNKSTFNVNFPSCLFSDNTREISFQIFPHHEVILQKIYNSYGTIKYLMWVSKISDLFFFHFSRFNFKINIISSFYQSLLIILNLRWGLRTLAVSSAHTVGPGD